MASKAPDHVRFQEQLWGVSTDGENFTWNRLLQWNRPNTLTTQYGIPGVSVVSLPNSNYFWGVIEVFVNVPGGT